MLGLHLVFLMNEPLTKYNVVLGELSGTSFDAGPDLSVACY